MYNKDQKPINLNAWLEISNVLSIL